MNKVNKKIIFYQFVNVRPVLFTLTTFDFQTNFAKSDWDRSIGIQDQDNMMPCRTPRSYGLKHHVLIGRMRVLISAKLKTYY